MKKENIGINLIINKINVVANVSVRPITEKNLNNAKFAFINNVKKDEEL